MYIWKSLTKAEVAKNNRVPKEVVVAADTEKTYSKEK